MTPEGVGGYSVSMDGEVEDTRPRIDPLGEHLHWTITGGWLAVAAILIVASTLQAASATNCAPGEFSCDAGAVALFTTLLLALPVLMAAVSVAISSRMFGRGAAIVTAAVGPPILFVSFGFLLSAL